MLKYLHIENIAVIEQNDIEFAKGFNVLTGETGAGKSIVIDAINAVLGERTSKELIRAGCDSALVSAVFGEISEKNIINLKEYDISPDEDGNIVITRKLSLTGKGYIKINGKPVTAGTLREIAVFLINIHGQHDNQALLNPDKHCGYIDALAENEEEIHLYYEEFRELNRIRKELSTLQIDSEEKEHKISLLKYQIKELEDADIKIGEYDSLKQKLKLAENYEETIKTLNGVNGMLTGSDETEGAVTLINQSQRLLEKLKNNDFEKCLSNLAEASSSLNDAVAFISDFLGNSEISEFDTNVINQRLDTLTRLMLKYGNNEEDLLAFLDSSKKELDGIEFADKRINELENELDKSTERLIDKAKILTDIRTESALSFEKAVSSVLAFLNMPDVRFKANITQGRYTKNGCDTVEFLISANAGEDLKPLHKIASGGELSRTMLAIKSALLDKDNVGTMIFDEIDTGISGFAADKVGVQLKRAAKGRQVICVTHLAQIAALADNHLLIEKTAENGRTYTDVSPLDYEGRIKEIARIMSGTDLTDNLYNSAKELIDRSMTYENL